MNDVTALRGDPELADVVAERGAYLCLMHMRGEPRTMQADPRYEDVASEVTAFLEERLRIAVDAGVPEELICLDPGIGFGKTLQHNFELVRRLDVLLALGTAGRDRLLAQALARAAPGRPRRDDGVGCSQRRCSRGRLRGRRDDPARPRRSRARRGARGRPGRGRSGGGRSGSTVSMGRTGEAALSRTTLHQALPTTLRPVTILVELYGLEIFGRHGLLPEERTGQTFLYDIELETSDAALSDRIEDAVDYREVAELARVVSEERRFDLLEPLAAAVADVLLARFDAERVRVRVRKPKPYGIAAEWSAATAERRR